MRSLRDDDPGPGCQAVAQYLHLAACEDPGSNSDEVVLSSTRDHFEPVATPGEGQQGGDRHGQDAPDALHGERDLDRFAITGPGRCGIRRGDREHRRRGGPGGGGR